MDQITGRNERPEELYRHLRILCDELRKLAREVELDASYDSSGKVRARSTTLRLLAILAVDGAAGRSVKKRLEEVPSKDVHYSRNKNMDPAFMPKSPQQALEWGWSDKVGADCHQFTSPDKSHTKYVSPDGKDEVIFDVQGNTVTAPEDYGTYNFANPSKDPVGHFYKDVLPWLIWGNDERDTTNMEQRVRSFVIDGSATAVAGMIAETESAVAKAADAYRNKLTDRPETADEL